MRSVLSERTLLGNINENGGNLKTYKSLAVVLAAVVLASGGGVIGSVLTAEPAQASSSQSQIDAAVQRILNDTNAERTKAGLAPLVLTPTLNTVAQNWTEEMGAHNSLIHNPDVFKQIHPTYTRAGENIAMGYQLQDVVTAWMNSSGHRANILGDFTHIGIGYWVDAAGHTWFTQDFGKYPTANATPNIIDPPVITPSSNQIMAVWYNYDLEYITDYKAEIYSSTGQLVESKTLNQADVDKYAPSYVFKGLTANTAYTIKLIANTTNVMGVRLTSPTRTVQVTTTEAGSAPTAPTSLTATAFTYDSATNAVESTLNWKAPTGIVGTVDYYLVTLQSAGNADLNFTRSATYYKLTGLSENTTYTVRVVAKVIGPDNITVSTPAATLSLKTPVVYSARASNPTGVTVSGVTYNTGVVSWKAPTDVDGTITNYSVEVSAGPGETYSNIYNTNTPVTSYRLLNLKPNYKYTVKVSTNVTSIDKSSDVTSTGTTTTLTTLAGESALSPIVKVSAPVTTVSQVGTDRMTLTWVKPTVTGMVTGYRVTVKAGTKVIQTYNLNASTYSKTVSSLAENTTYTVVVDALAVSPDGKNRATASTTKTATTRLSLASTVKVAAPASFGVTTARTAVTATWRMPAVTGKVINYTVTLKSGTRTVKTLVMTGGKYSFTGLKTNTPYTVTVKANAISANGKYRASSPLASKTVRTLR